MFIIFKRMIHYFTIEGATSVLPAAKVINTQSAPQNGK
jgi:hypothetical protein